MTGPLKHSRVALTLVSNGIYLVECRCGWYRWAGVVSKNEAAELYRMHKKEASK